MNSESIILRQRIKFAVRRSTGLLVDMDAMLRSPQLHAPRIRAWRQLGAPGLDELLDQLECELQREAPPRSKRPDKAISAGRGAFWLVPSTSA